MTQRMRYEREPRSTLIITALEQVCMADRRPHEYRILRRSVALTNIPQQASHEDGSLGKHLRWMASAGIIVGMLSSLLLLCKREAQHEAPERIGQGQKVSCLETPPSVWVKVVEDDRDMMTTLGESGNMG
jgi:uncharacterized iron-regulated membrane protein